MSSRRQRAKASAPGPGGVLRRERLFALLDGTRAKAVWIAGPPGAGKTTLVSSWIEARRERCLWYRAQPSDGDLASFYYELAATAGARRGELPTFTAEYRGGEAVFARRFFRELVRRRRPPWILVLDDLHEVAAPEQLLAALRVGIEELPPGVRLILVSREQPHACLARLVANGLVSVLSGNLLLLTSAEALAIAHALAPDRPRAELDRICARAAGWAAGLVLLATSPAGEAREARGGAALLQYLASELLDRVDPETRRILVDASIPPTLPASIVNAVCGSTRALAILEGLSRRAYLVARRGRDDPVFELHPLAREFLVGRARAERPPDRLHELEARAAGLLVEAGRVEDAVDLYVRAEAWTDVARLVLAHAPHLAATGRIAKLQRWLDALPPEHASAIPWFWYWRAVCRLSFDPAEARAHLARAWTGFEAAGDATGIHLAFAAAVDSVLFEWGDLHPLGEWIDRFDAASLRHPGAPPAEVLHRSAAAMLAGLTFHRPGSDAFARWEAHARGVVEDASAAPGVRLSTGTFLILGCAFRGEGARAAAVVEALAPLARARGPEPRDVVSWLASEAVHFWHRGDASRATEAAELGLEIARDRGVHVWDFVLRQQLVLAALAGGDTEEARRHLAGILAEPWGGPLHAISLCEMESLLARHEGDGARAVEAARCMVKAAHETGMPFAELLASMHLALALLEAGDPSAPEAARATRRAAEAAPSALAQMMADLAEAELHRQEGDLAAARAHLRRGLRTSREMQITPDVWLSRARLANLCAEALDAGVETDHVLALVRRLGLAAPPGCCAERWPWAVRARLLGQVELHVHGTPLRALTWAHRRPLDVFAALVAAGGAGSVRDLAATLWPESDGDLAHHALETATYRLRRLFSEDVVRQKAGALVLDRTRCWTDVGQLDATLRRADACLQRRDEAGALSSAASAIALYRGPFLPGADEPWALEARERVRARLRRCLSDLERLGAERAAVRGLRSRAVAADAELAGAEPS